MKDFKLPSNRLLLFLTAFIIISFLIFFIGPEMIKSRLDAWEIKTTGADQVQGQIGDVFGGTIGPLIAWVAALLTFAAFWVQYEANQEQKKQFEKQGYDIAVERFENKYYAMIELHRANVDEMSIANKLRGRKCFVQMFYELKHCFIVAWDVLNETPNDVKEEYQYGKINIVDFAYKIFFFGIGYNSEKQLMYSFKVPEMHLFRRCKERFIELQDRFELLRLEKPNESIYVLVAPESGIADEKTFEISYFPFDGHVNRLGHYYRHLFQTVSYVIDQKDSFIDQGKKYSYIKTLRAQLSNHEQLLLYYNSLAWFDDQWKIPFTRYRFIKNLPLPLADFGVKPEIHFKSEIEELRKEGIEMFEWNE